MPGIDESRCTVRSLRARSRDNSSPLVWLTVCRRAYLCPGCGGWLAFVNPELTRELGAAIQRWPMRGCAPRSGAARVEPALFGTQAHLPEMMSRLRARRDLTVQRLCRYPASRA